jgi:hypothetical protein
VSNLQRLCGSVVHGDHIDGTIRTTTQQEDFVIFDFKKTKPAMKCNSVDIPAPASSGSGRIPNPGKTQLTELAVLVLQG